MRGRITVHWWFHNVGTTAVVGGGCVELGFTRKG
jgi:hypothetical protein